MAEKFKIKGILTRISEIKQPNPAKKFKLRNFILEVGTKEQPNPIKFQLTGKYLDYVDNRMINTEVDVEFYINGNATKKGYFNNLSAVAVLYVGSRRGSS